MVAYSIELHAILVTVFFDYLNQFARFKNGHTTVRKSLKNQIDIYIVLLPL